MRRLVAAVVLAAPLVAGAHPLGNFTINRYAALAVSARTIGVRYVVDMAEIPAFQAITDADENGNGSLDPAERDAYLRRMARELASGLVLTVDGKRVALAAGGQSLELPPGAGGLPTLRLETELTAALTAAPRSVAFRDTNFAGRPGWQEIIADGAGGVVLAESSVPRVDRSRALQAYPSELLSSPPQVSEALLRLDPAPPAATADASAAPVPAGGPRARDRLSELIATRQPLGPAIIFTSLLVAAALGALHALTPGHGKTVVAAYLVGARGTARHALVLGLVVTATHTLGVYALGLVTLTASHWVLPERLLPWLGVVSGLLVLGIGASLAAARLQAAVGEHDHGEYEHDHDHHHHHGHAHSHHHHHQAPTARSLIALGVSGGLLPCPSALVVMLAAIALGRIAFGLVLIVAFSVGLAAVLTGIGIVLVHARRVFDRLPLDGRLARYAPVASALVITLAGLAIVAQSLGQTGLLRAGT